MKNIVIAPMGDNMDALFVGVREFLTDRVVLVSSNARKEEADKVKENLEKFKIPTNIHLIEGDNEVMVWEGTFKAISSIRSAEEGKEVLVNVATGDKTTRCAATSAAFVNGLKAFTVSGDNTMMLPVMKFSYYKIITDKKMEILKILNEKNCCSSLEELSKKTSMSLPLVSYHINGNLKSEGLKTMGLINTTEERGRISVDLSSLGRMVVKGYVS